MAAAPFGTTATIFFRSRRSELSRQIAVDFEADADLDEGRSGPGHGLLLRRARPPVANQRANLSSGSVPRNSWHAAGTGLHAVCFTAGGPDSGRDPRCSDRSPAG